ncbi:FKBP-type peptidyl-prolyl cis-trans isomerase [Tenacibaculum mesophilum]|uniref:Peptidyl-prolyl cis-trans isomerase n=1 Tax=Tenacibaculum mesophilum TaxID=104268 RepID=A0ABN5T4G9_9FLAO|nr:FKBP-type peptidyl-prolyl cis-trans isomerase [Tenacibaculum mesophilum]AZJ32166.1 FKBP-type peptidyl-prolyl cis-trans isomerase [Tenacibaculum mesophilum]QFS27424.1 FKBP-type peptidyl-prolyl cis-trans isomerase [Tenacibaculum mesophilum]BFF35143.1 FKBP-type peptidyl-prolyl cis-trans isomerase N-terminal domain-containing protein [Tenacibaculum mesophilum]SHG18354.1 FKBP-type peptidyl-prolyl cis-trans isomerase FklB [Tenacibaculum mesophilum]
MKLTNILAATVVGLSIVSCSNGQFKQKSSLATEVDSVSYALGLDMANKIKMNFDDMDQDLFVQGFKNGMDSTNLLVESKDINNILRAFFQKKQQEKMKQMQEEQAKKAEAEFGDNKKAGEEFLAINKAKEGVKTTESGLQYVVLKEGEGEVPTANSRVKVHYHGTLIDGTVFDSSVERGEPTEFGVGQVIKGWTEGLQLMKPGAKYKFFIPQELAYGAQQRGQHIKPFSALVFEVELLEIK